MGKYVGAAREESALDSGYAMRLAPCSMRFQSEIRFPNSTFRDLIMWEQFRIKLLPALRTDSVAEFMFRVVHQVAFDRQP